MAECKKPDILDFKRMFADVFKFQQGPTWVQTTYNLDSQVILDGLAYVSMVDMNIADPSMDDGTNWNLLLPEWSDTETYAVNDEVVYNGMVFRSLRDSNTDAITISQSWMRLAPIEIVYPDAVPWVEPIAYMAGDKALYLDETTWTWAWYGNTVDDNYEPPSDESWTNLSTQSPNPVLVTGFVKDADIEEAMREAATIVPDGTPMACNEYQMAFLLMTAHWVISDWQAKNLGMNASGASGILTGRAAGKMSASYAVSPLLQQNPLWQPYLTTPWGVKAIAILARYNVGNVMFVQGAFTRY